MKPPPMPIVRAVMAGSQWLAKLRRALTPPPLTMVELTSGGFIVSCAILTATRLGVPDALAGGAKTAEELARELELQPEPLYRVLRALAHAGVLDQDGARFSLNSLSRLLTREQPGSMRDILLLGSERWHHELWGELGDVVKTGRSAHERVLGRPLFQHLADDDDANGVFNRAMVSFSAQTAEAVVAAYDFRATKTLVDVGGGTGHLLAATLRRCAEQRGVLLDLPHVVRAAPAVLGEISSRVDVVGGDFFRALPSGHDGYALMNILHNWSDDEAVAILERCREAIDATGKLFVIEMVVPEDKPHFAAIFDLEMMVLFRGGRERTRTEFEQLFARAGFTLDRVVDTPSPASILVGLPTMTR